MSINSSCRWGDQLGHRCNSAFSEVCSSCAFLYSAARDAVMLSGVLDTPDSHALYVVLTPPALPADEELVTWNRHAAALRTNTLDRLKDEFPGSRLLWTREFQARGAVHFNVILVLPREVTSADIASVEGHLREVWTATADGLVLSWSRDFCSVQRVGADKGGFTGLVGYITKASSLSAVQVLGADRVRELAEVEARLFGLPTGRRSRGNAAGYQGLAHGRSRAWGFLLMRDAKAALCRVDAVSLNFPPRWRWASGVMVWAVGVLRVVFGDDVAMPSGAWAATSLLLIE